MKANPTFCTSGRKIFSATHKPCGEPLQAVWYRPSHKRDTRAALLCPRCDGPALAQAALRNSAR